MQLNPEHLVKLIVNEAFESRRAVVAVFVAVNLLMVMIGLVWPKGYSAYTTILMDEKNIIQPLMQGAAVTTDVVDRSRLAKEIIYGRKIMNQIMSETGWLRDKPSPEEQEKIMKKLIRRTAIVNIGHKIIKIEYRDDDPERAFLITKRYAELFIDEALGAKAAESQAAFDFIDKQVQEYHDKLIGAEEQLKEFRSANLDAQPGTDGNISTRLNALQTRIQQADEEFKDAGIKKMSLEKQLNGEVEAVSLLSRENQYRTRIAELQSQLETLRLSYLDTYPDIVRIRHQIDDLNEQIAAEKQRRETAKATGRVPHDDTVVNNPMYQQLRNEMSQTQVRIDTLSARIAEAKRQMQSELERGKRVHGSEATLAELTRDYQVNRDIYQDLLKRRENARVSMNLDKEKQGLTFRIQEPATIPLEPNGMRFWHYIVVGLVFGALLALALVYAKLRLDPRMRIGSFVAERQKIPLLAVVPHLWSPMEVGMVRRDVQRLSAMVASTLTVVVLVSLLRLLQVV